MWPNLSNNFTKNASVVGAAARVAAAGSLRAIFARFRPVWVDRLAFQRLTIRTCSEKNSSGRCAGGRRVRKMPFSRFFAAKRRAQRCVSCNYPKESSD